MVRRMCGRERIWLLRAGVRLGLGIITVLGAVLGTSMGVNGCASGGSTVDAGDEMVVRPTSDLASVGAVDLALAGDLADADSDLNILPGDTVLRVHYPRNDARYSKVSVRGDGFGHFAVLE